MKTRAEKLHDKIGDKIQCDFCHQNKRFDSSWMMTEGPMFACPECVELKLKEGHVFCSI